MGSLGLVDVSKVDQWWFSMFDTGRIVVFNFLTFRTELEVMFFNFLKLAERCGVFFFLQVSDTR